MLLRLRSEVERRRGGEGEGRGGRKEKSVRSAFLPMESSLRLVSSDFKHSNPEQRILSILLSSRDHPTPPTSATSLLQRAQPPRFASLLLRLFSLLLLAPLPSFDTLFPDIMGARVGGDVDGEGWVRCERMGKKTNKSVGEERGKEEVGLLKDSKEI